MKNQEYPSLAYSNGELLNPGDGYRLLRVGEEVKEGDEIAGWALDELGHWYPAYLPYWEHPLTAKDCIIRRPIASTASQQLTVGEQLDKANQIILDLMDGNFNYWEEIRAETGLSEARCKEILAYFDKLVEGK
jgi:hypothetical protein